MSETRPVATAAQATTFAPPTVADPPLAVDLDGTLLRTDSLHEGLVQLVRGKPLHVLGLPAALARGRPAFKRAIAAMAPLDAASLPYDEQVLALLRDARGRRPLVLCTAADARVAEAVAAHLGLFDEVIATRDDTNLDAERKAAALVARFGARGFDYAGNDACDLPVFAAARQAIVVAPTAELRRRLHGVTNLSQRLDRADPAPARALLRSMRPVQWLKNLLVFLPMLATADQVRLDTFPPALLAFLAFSLTASSVYLLNDLLDLGSDRGHPRKRRRPLAAGTLPIAHAAAAVPLLLTAGLGVGLAVSLLFTGVLLLYYLSALLYAFWLKRVPLLDTLVLAGLYTLRVLAGSAAIAVTPSVWLLAFSMFFFLSLALAKRHSELVELPAPADGVSAIPGREYRPEDLHTLISQGSASGYAAVLVLALYIDTARMREGYRHPELIWLICPLLLYWINKLWLNSQRRELEDDPLVWAIRNRVSRAIAVISVALLMLARWAP